MAGVPNDDDDEITGINVTPLVDVMLVLLIIFMVTSNYIVNKTINVKLPKAETGENKVTTLDMGFSLDSSSQLYLDGKVITFEEIPLLIKEFKKRGAAENKTTQALISADEKTPHGAVVKLIDSIRKNGITDFAINVEGNAN